MSEFRIVTPRFAVASQLSPDDITRVAKAGFKTLICNRPDDEAPEMLEDEARTAAHAAGLNFVALPFAGTPPPDVISETGKLIAHAPAPMLAYCRSGTRSTLAWAMAEARSGSMEIDAIVESAGGAGYDLSRLRPALDRLRAEA